MAAIPKVDIPLAQFMEPIEALKVRLQPVQDELLDMGQNLAKLAPARPVLPDPEAPVERVEITLAKLVDTLNKIRAMSLKEGQSSIEFKTSEVIRKQKETHKIQAELHEVEENKSFWDLLKKIATCVLHSVTIISGAVLMATGLPPAMVAGGMLIGSGVTGIVAFALGEAGVDSRIVGALSIVSAGLGIAGGVVCFSSVAASLPKMVAAIGSSVTGVASGVTTIGSSIWESKSFEIQGEKAVADGNLALSKESLNQISLRIQEILSRLNDPESAAVRAALQSNEAIRKIQREIQG